MSRYEYDSNGTAYSDGRREGAAAERAAIVKFLTRPQADALIKKLSGYPREAWFLTADRDVAPIFQAIKEAIEHGEHDEPPAAKEGDR